MERSGQLDFSHFNTFHRYPSTMFSIYCLDFLLRLFCTSDARSAHSIFISVQCHRRTVAFDTTYLPHAPLAPFKSFANFLQIYFDSSDVSMWHVINIIQVLIKKPFFYKIRNDIEENWWISIIFRFGKRTEAAYENADYDGPVSSIFIYFKIELHITANM